jgi:hypothetical protein
LENLPKTIVALTIPERCARTSKLPCSHVQAEASVPAFRSKGDADPDPVTRR